MRDQGRGLGIDDPVYRGRPKAALKRDDDSLHFKTEMAIDLQPIANRGERALDVRDGFARGADAKMLRAGLRDLARPQAHTVFGEMRPGEALAGILLAAGSHIAVPHNIARSDPITFHDVA